MVIRNIKALRHSLLSTGVALALFLSTATQYRISGIGMGEIFGVISVLAFVFYEKYEDAFIYRSWCFLFCLSWVLLLFGTTANQVFAFTTDEFLRDYVAIVYAHLLCIVVLHLSNHSEEVVRKISIGLVIFPYIQVLIFVKSILISDGSAWFGENGLDGVPFINRFVGWSDNPNQIGIALSAMPFYLVYSLKFFSSRLMRFIIVCSIIQCIGIELLIRSNTVFFAWYVGFIIIACSFLFSKNQKIARRFLYFLLLGVIIGVSVYFASDILDVSNKGEDGDANGRYPLWLNAIRAFLKSPIVGLGPGAHSGFTGPFQGVEAHFLILDLATQGGVLLVMVFISMAMFSCWYALKSKNTFVIAGFISIMVEMLTHNTERQPLFWIYLVFPMIVFASNLKRLRELEVG